MCSMLIERTFKYSNVAPAQALALAHAYQLFLCPFYIFFNYFCEEAIFKS